MQGFTCKSLYRTARLSVFHELLTKLAKSETSKMLSLVKTIDRFKTIGYNPFFLWVNPEERREFLCTVHGM